NHFHYCRMKVDKTFHYYRRKNKMKKLLVAFLVALSVLGLAACGSAKEYGYGKAYSLVHGHYVGVAEVVVDKDNKVVSVDFEEYDLPYNAAQVGTVGSTPALVDNPDVILAGPADVAGTKIYAKYFKVNSLLFVASLNGSNVEYKADGIEIHDWVKQEENAKGYVEAILEGKVFIATSTGSKHSTLVASGNAGKGFAKSATGYWTDITKYP